MGNSQALHAWNATSAAFCLVSSVVTCCKARGYTCPPAAQTNSPEVHSPHQSLYCDPRFLGAACKALHKYRGAETAADRRPETRSWRINQRRASELRMSGSHRVTGWLSSEGTSGGQLVLPPAPAGPLKLPAAQLLEEALSVKDFIRSLKSEIQNVAAKTQNSPSPNGRSREISSALMTATNREKIRPKVFL